MPGGKAVRGSAIAPPCASTRASAASSEGDACQIHQRSATGQRGCRGPLHQGAASAGLRVVGKDRTLAGAHGFAAHGVTQHRLIKSLGGVQTGGGNFEPADGVAHYMLLQSE